MTLASTIAQAFGRFTYALLLPAIDRDLIGSYSLAGLLALVNLGAYFLGTLAVSGIARHVDPAVLIRGGLVASTGGLTVLSQAGDAMSLGVGLALTGAGGAFIWVPAPGLAGSVVSPAKRGAAIGVSGSGIGLGIIFASALAAALQRIEGEAFWRTVWLIEAGLSLLALVLCVVLLRPAPPAGGAYDVRAGALRRVPGWLGLVGAFAAFGVAYSIYTTYLVTALVDDAGFSGAHASAVYTLFGAAWVFGGPLLGPLSDRVGRGRTLVVGYVGMAAVVLMVTTGAEPFAALSAIGFGLAMSGLPAVIAAHLSDHLSPREFGGAFGRLTLFFGAAQLAGPPLGGWLAESTGSFTLPFVMAGVAAGVGALCCVTVPGKAS